jgi:putative CocE/NonD family hydrolase
MDASQYAGSQIVYEVGVDRDVMTPMRDGVRLAADIYYPAVAGQRVAGRFPALLERTPYNKRRPFLVQTARYFTRRGYVTVMQDVRGRFASEGEWYFLAAVEAPDGYDTIAWMAQQDWSDGQVGTMGLSYTTANQQALAVLKPPALKAQFLLDGGYNYFHRTLRHSGAFELGVLLPYVFRMAREGHELAHNAVARAAFEQAWHDMQSWLQKLPIRPGHSPLRLAPSYERWFIDMLTTSDYTDYWKHPGCNLEEHIDDYPDMPIYLQTSWYGHHIWATTTKYNEFAKRHNSPTKLLMGHWTHGYDDYGRTWCGEVDFGPDAMLDNLNDLRLQWFDHWLKQLPGRLMDEAPVRLFVMGGGSGRKNLEGRLEHGGVWRNEHAWPLARTLWTPFYLHADGHLAPELPVANASPSSYTYNPADPVPTIGGNTQNPLLPQLIQGGAFDQRGRADLWVCKDTLPLAARQDVLVFQTDLLSEDVEITGPITVKLWVSSSAVDTDFTAKLIDVYPPNEDYPEGFAMNLADGIIRARYRNSREHAELLTPGEIYALTIEPQATSNLFKTGHRIRLDVSSSNFPHFDVNPNTGEPLGRSRRLVVAHNTIFHDAVHPSHVVLPVIPPGP